MTVEMSRIQRRKLLKLSVAGGAGLVGTVVGAASSGAAATIDIKHSSMSAIVMGTGAASETITVSTTGGGLFEFGGDAGRSLRIRNAATGKTTTFKPDHDGETYATDHVTIFTGSLEEVPSMDGLVDVRTPEGSESSVTVSGSYSGDTGIFTDRTFAPYVVELLDGSGAVVATTDEKVYGTNYEWEFDQDGATATITRDEEVDENWLVEFEIENDLSGDTRAISHEDGDDVFEIPLDELHVEDGEYEWELVIYNGPNSSNEDIAIRLPGGDEQLVTIGAVDEDTGDDSGTTESTGGSDSSESDDNSSGDESDDDSASSADEVPGFGSVATIAGLTGGYALLRRSENET